MRKIFLSIIAIFIFSLVAQAQLRAYTFEFNDEFGGKQKCYLTLRSIVAEWDMAQLSVLFNCYESADTRAKNIAPRKILSMNLQGEAFAANVLKPITNADVGMPTAVILSNSAWDIALDEKFIDDYAYDAATKQQKAVKKSLRDLNAVRIDVSIDSLAGK